MSFCSDCIPIASEFCTGVGLRSSLAVICLRKLAKGGYKYNEPRPPFRLIPLGFHRMLEFIFLALLVTVNGYVWPSPQLDALESARFEQLGHNEGIAGFVDPCIADNFEGNLSGRSDAADWIRNVRRSPPSPIVQLSSYRHIMIWRRTIPWTAREA
jgi:hypothetical protein